MGTNVALVTGASSGIGLELAREHAKRGGDLVLVARRRDRLEEIKKEFEATHGVNVALIERDLGLADAAEGLVRDLEQQGLQIDVLINNAGFGGYGKFHERAWEDDRKMIELNVMALAGLTRLVLPGMVERGSGRILNVASVAGFLPGPYQATYYATKAFVITLSEAIADELKGTGVTVTALCPGATETEFIERADLNGTRLFVAGMDSAAKVAAHGYEAMLNGKTLAIPGVSNKFLARVVIPFTPRPIVTWLSRVAMQKT